MKQTQPVEDHAPGRSKTDSFGLWLGPDNEPTASPPTKATPAPAASADVSAIRAIRAGRGPLASVVRSPGAKTPGEAASVEEREVTAPAPIGHFRPLEKSAAVLLIAVAGLLVGGSYAIRADLRAMAGLQTLERQNALIREYNHARSILVQHLARDRKGEMDRLRGYAEWMDEKAPRDDGGVIVFTPQGTVDGPKNVVRVDLGDLRDQVAHDIEAVGSWSPPAPIKDYNDLRFSTAELLASRLPTGATLALVLVALMVWSTLAYGNLPCLQAQSDCSRPHLVPLFWLTPGLNLYLPALVMADIWRESDPHRLHRPKSLGPPVISLWWLALLGAIGLMAFAVHQMVQALGITLMVRAAKFALYADIAVVAIGTLTGVLVVTASWNQVRRRRLALKFPLRRTAKGSWGLD